MDRWESDACCDMYGEPKGFWWISSTLSWLKPSPIVGRPEYWLYDIGMVKGLWFHGSNEGNNGNNNGGTEKVYYWDVQREEGT